MAEIWPPQLNHVLDRGSFSIEAHSDIARTEFEDGPQLVRVRFSNPTTVYNGTLTFTNNEFQIFKGYYLNILNQGSRWFEIPIWDGNNYTIHKARFKERYQVKDEGWDQNTITISLEVRQYFTYSSFATYILGLYGVDVVIYDVADPLQYIVNVLYPSIFRKELMWDNDTENNVIIMWDQEDGTETKFYWEF